MQPPSCTRGWLAVVLATALCLPIGSGFAVNVATYHNDDARSGHNPNETVLTPANVNAATFGKLFSQPVDGAIYAQPLYVENVRVPGKGMRNVVFVVTQRNSVYAFDADSNEGSSFEPLWHVSFIHPEDDITPVPNREVRSNDIQPEIGITSTPVIDLAGGTLYAVSKTKERRGYAQRLHALDIATGAEKFGGPVEVNALVRGLGEGSNPRGYVIFRPLPHLNRPGLSLANGVVYGMYSSHGDRSGYHGWVIGHDAETLRVVQVFNTTPNGQDGGIWMSGAAPAIDSDGYLYLSTGDGSFDPQAGVSNFGNSFLKLKAEAGKLTLADYFTPYDHLALSSADLDVGGGGVLVLPDSMGSAVHRRLLIGCGKGGTLYLVDRERLGGFNPANDAHIVQSIRGAVGPCFSMPAVFNGRIYMQAGGDALKAFAVSEARISETLVSQSAAPFGYPGATPSISANGIDDAVVWVLRTDAYNEGGPAVLYAYAAEDLSRELYNSNQAGPRDIPGPAVKFTLPTIANGKVYVGTATALAVYGPLSDEATAGLPVKKRN
jgi:hypothetical protein